MRRTYKRPIRRKTPAIKTGEGMKVSLALNRHLGFRVIFTKTAYFISVLFLVILNVHPAVLQYFQVPEFSCPVQKLLHQVP